MHIEDTIAAISTAAGQGGIGIVRLSGPDSIKIADPLFRSKKNKTLLKARSHSMLFGYILDPSKNEIIDEALVSVMRAPDTYTREDIVEINCHGGTVPLKRILELLINHGARLAGPGEFTQRAFLNGRIDLAQAEAVLDMINSLTVQSQRRAAEQLSGRLSNRFIAVRESLTGLTALVETYIDFPEDDIEQPSVEDLINRAVNIKQSLTALIESARYGIILREGIKTAIIGRPNVGKSSLLNALLEHDRAIVTETPGTTRDIIEECLNINGLPVRIIDTAGIRHTSDSAEIEGVRRSLQTMKNADLVLLVFDGSKELTDNDRELIFKTDPEKTIFIINKTDLDPGFSAKALSQIKEDMEGKIVTISAKKATGLTALKERITDMVSGGYSDSNAEIVTNSRHLDVLERARASTDSFIKGVENGTSPEFLSLELREALDAIGEILGITTSEEILNKIFNDFCIGK